MFTLIQKNTCATFTDQNQRLSFQITKPYMVLDLTKKVLET